MDPEAFEGADFLVTSGDYDKLLEKVKYKNLIQKDRTIFWSEQKNYYADK